MDEQITKITQEMWDTFKINEPKENRRDKEITFLIQKIAILQLEINALKEKINERDI